MGLSIIIIKTRKSFLEPRNDEIKYGAIHSCIKY